MRGFVILLGLLIAIPTGVRASANIRGLALLSELNCGNCHELQAKPRGAPNLRNELLPAKYLRNFIAAPTHAKPGTVMPHALARLDEVDRRRVAIELSHFLLSHTKARAVEKVSRGSGMKGRQLYTTIGCVACHGVDPMDVSAKYTLSSLTAYLKNPLLHRPSGRMPDMKLDHFEAVNLATYLLPKPVAHKAFEIDRSLVRKGGQHFSTYGCNRCHDLLPKKRDEPMIPVKDPRAGCLSTDKGPWPDYGLTDEQRSDLRAAIGDRSERSADERIKVQLTRLNCVACHSRGEFGGPSDALEKHFTGADPNLGDQGRIPPHLTHTGAKLKPDWLRKVLLHGESVRPYLHTRMPKFGAANVEPLIQLFAEADRLEPIAINRVKDAKQAKEAGRQLAGSRGGLNCVACHTFRLQSAAPIKALDLTMMADRLQEQWFHQYLRHPQGFQPLTIMPSFWPDGNATLKAVLAGNTSRQIDALWQYLSHGRNVRAPAGIILEPLPLVVKDEAVMLRRNSQGIGRRGINVGYPSKINLAFDAGQMRLAAIWKGDFIETSPAWRGQGSGAVRIMSRDIARFPAGAAFALLDHANAAWPTNQSRQLPGFQFKGYTLDEKQRPTFRYEFQGNQITDRFVDRKDDNGKAYFERRLVLQKSMDTLYFLAAKDMKLIRVHSEFPPINRGREVLFDLAGKKEFTLEYHLLK